MNTDPNYGMKAVVSLPWADTVLLTREELKNEGFGVLTEIDVRETLRQKLGKEFRPYVILGACNPPLAHRALEAETDIGLFLPCNVIVYETTPGECVIAAFDPMAMVPMASNRGEIEAVGSEVRERLGRVVAAVAAGKKP